MTIRGMGVFALVLVAPLTFGSAATAKPATVAPIYHSQQLPALNTLPECFEETEGQQVGTETFTGQVVTTSGGTLNIRGTATLDYVVTFPDGRYVSGVATEHITLNLTPSVTVGTVVVVEPRTIFTADGQPTGRVWLHAVSHYTYQAGELRSVVDRFAFLCH